MTKRTAERVHVRPSDGPCDVHAWTAEDFRKRLLEEMRARHGKDGLNVCVECIDRAKVAILKP